MSVILTKAQFARCGTHTALGTAAKRFRRRLRRNLVTIVLGRPRRLPHFAQLDPARDLLVSLKFGEIGPVQVLGDHHHLGVDVVAVGDEARNVAVSEQIAGGEPVMAGHDDILVVADVAILIGCRRHSDRRKEADQYDTVAQAL